MRFAEVLKEVVWCLLGEGQVSYQRLRRDFDLDEAQLEDLRTLLIATKRCAVDRDGRFLVWAPAGPPERAPALAPLPPAAADAPALPDAARRQLTVMFCDLVGSTDLSTRLDPEDLSDLIGAYRDAVTTIVRRYDGFVAKYMGDGILVYFGYPYSQGRDAERALHTAIEIVEAMPGLNAGIAGGRGIALAVRIGVATGLVMVGETIGEGAATEQAVVGETPNLAARLQGLAPPDGIVVGALTRQLAGDGFHYEDLGPQQVKGVPEPVTAWRVTLRRQAESETEGGPATPTLLVGRDEEVGLLRRAWHQASDERRGQVVLLSGEPGIGKSSLIRTLRAELQGEAPRRMTFQCSPYHADSALYPVVEHLKRAARWEAGDSPATRLEKLETMLGAYGLPLAETAPLVAALLSLEVPEGRYPRLDLTPQQLRQQTQDALIAMMLEEAERRPVLAMWEDLHWADASTLELIGLLIEQVPTVPLLMILTFRPEFNPPWPGRSHQTPITLNRLERPQTEALARQLAGGRALPEPVLEHIVRKTDGVPLYVEELTKAVLSSGNLREEGDRYELTGPLSGLAIPASLQEVLMSRLDRLPSMREVAQLGAVLGREFAYDMLRSVAAVEETRLRDGLGLLVDAELLYQRGRPPRATYVFKHALIQDAAYQSLLRRTRQQYHQRVATLLERDFPEIVASQPDLVAHHYTEAGAADAAIAYWLKAGRKAAQRSANQEVIGHAGRALELLAVLPPGRERDARELPLQRLVCSALMASKGYGAAETNVAFQRARELCEVLDSDEILPVLSGVCLFELTRAHHGMARDIGLEIAGRARSGGDVASEIVGLVYAGCGYIHLGDCVPAVEVCRRAGQLFEAERPSGFGLRFGIEAQAAGYAYGGWALWLAGQPDQARASGERTLAILETVPHPFSLARAYYWTAVIHQMRGDWPMVEERARQAVKASQELGFPMSAATGRVLHGAARAALGDAEAGIREMRLGLADYHATGARFQRSYLLCLLAEALGDQGRLDEALEAVEEAREFVEATDERYWEAELARVQARLLLAGGTDEAVVDAHLVRGLEIARAQQARSLELRAATALARHRSVRGECAAAASLLRPVLAGFSEGFDTPDLVGAKALLAQMG
ncbi:MAG: AAA family ATPase [Dongiaceae bacterium]